MKLITEVNGVTVQITSSKMLNLSGLTDFMNSLDEGRVVIKLPETPVKRGRGRPPGARNKTKKGVRK